ncbi:helix-turn-helix transcriptional regulator [Marinibacterium sp. SX1]|uniref:helix-turn-helix transcriptional regulator n=1 Tax=Marinibacterium sp. SX1 TaxID=3388424 RepID=UPI003D185139
MFIETPRDIYRAASHAAPSPLSCPFDPSDPAGRPAHRLARHRIDDRLTLVTFHGDTLPDDIGATLCPAEDAALLCVHAGTLALSDGHGQRHLLTAGTASVGRARAADRPLRIAASDGPCAFALLTVQPACLADLLREHCPGCLAPRQGCPTGPVLPPIQLLPDLRAVLHQLMASDLRSELLPMFRTAKAYELLSLTLDQLCSHAQDAWLGPRDIRQLRRARAILDDRVAEPPSLLELAREVGINDFKLKKGFKALFGTTPYSYLTSRRMSLAREALVGGEASVTEVANAVGYTNLGHFAAAFRKKYGAAPRDFRKQARLAIAANSAAG